MVSLADRYNATCSREDCRWVDTPDGGVTLSQDRSWTEAHTKQMARRAEADRRQHAHRQKFPVQEAAE